MGLEVKRDASDWLRRRGARRRVSMVAHLVKEGGEPFRVLVRNLSYEGCEILSERALVVGQSVELEMPRAGRIKAQVRWVAGDRAGLSFLLGNSIHEERRARIGV